MKSPTRFRLLSIVLGCGALGVSAFGQQATPPKRVDKATAYYHYSLGHLYAELAGNKGDYLNRAIENYRLALKADPDASFIAEELTDVYIQAGRLREAVSEAEGILKSNPNDINARRILGRIYTRMIGDSQQGKVDEAMLRKAIEQYQKIAELQPKDIDTWLLLGRLHKIAQNSVESEKAYQKILEIDPDNEDALTGLAIVYADVGDSKRSAELLRRVADKNPSLRTLMALASQYEQMRDHALAAETLRRTLEVAPGNAEVKRAYAQNLLMSDQIDEALKVYQELATSDPKDFQNHLRISQIYRQKQEFAKARESAQKARELEPDNLEVQYNEINLLEAEGKGVEATAALRNLLSTTAKKSYSTGERGNRVVLLERLGLMYRSNEQYQEAVDTFRQIAELDADLGARASAQIIDTYRMAKSFDKALAEADAALKKFPKDRTIRGVRASVLAEMGKTDEAVADIKSLLDGKDDRETYITLAQIYEKAKNYSEMAKAIDAAEKLSDTKEEKEAVAVMRGAMYERMKQYDRAEAEFRKVLELDPKNASALNYLGYMLADRNVRLSEALDLVRQALEIDPNNGAYLDSLGWVYFRMDDLEKAEQYLQRAVQRFAKDPTIHDHLGDVYFKQGKLKEAIEQWQSSLKNWESASASEADPADIARVQKKLENARVRLAKETRAGGAQQ